MSSATVRKIDNGTADSFRRSSVVAYLAALGLRADAWDRLLAGEDIDDLTVVARLDDVNPVVAALRNDPLLTDLERTMLVDTYQKMVRDR